MIRFWHTVLVTDGKVIKSYSDIPGFFMWVDRWVFATLLSAQADTEPGVLVELGAYLGKSAVIIGNAVRPGERFVVVDLFGREDLLADAPGGAANREENQTQYRNLTREKFEANYSALHTTLPEVVENLTSAITQHVEPGSARFVHIDAGHLYEQVHEDIVNVKKLLRRGGVVAFDDFRTEHTPGVSAAIWQAVFEDGLIPIAVTPQKLYGVYDDSADKYLDVLRKFVTDDPRRRWWMQEQQVLGRPLLRIKNAQETAPAPKIAPRALRPVKSPKPERNPTVANSSIGYRVLRNLARNYLPSGVRRRLKAAQRKRHETTPRMSAR